MRTIFSAISFALIALAAHAQYALDPSFGSNGIIQAGFGYHGLPTQNECKQLLLRPDGSFYLLFEMNSQTFIVRRLANGALDNSYGENGYSMPSWVRGPHGVLMPDGSIIVGGSSFGSDFNWNFTLVRYLPNGKLDKTFAGNGTQLTDFWGQNETMYAMALQPDNKIIAVGVSNNHFAIARYLMDGTLDNSFSQDGIDSVNFGSVRDVAYGVAVKNDGRIVVVGQSNFFGPIDCMAVACYLPNGTLDSNFSGDGMDTLALSNDCGANAVAIQADGKVLIAGYYFGSSARNFTVVRLNSDGTFDNGFSSDGIQTAYFTGWDEAFAVCLDPNGKIVAGGFGLSQWIVSRMNNDGSPDLSFSGNGKSNIHISNDCRLYSLAIQQDGKILAAGEASFTSIRYAAARFNTEGGPDYTFGVAGQISDYKPSSGTMYYASAIQPDGKIIAVGDMIGAGDTSNICVARYLTNGTLDNSFSGDGKLLFRFGAIRSHASAVVIQRDGKILIGGTFFNNQNEDFALARLNRDGTLDNSFSGGGIVLTDFIGGDDFLSSICLQPDGKIIAGGQTSASLQQNDKFALARYNSNGTLDNSFGNAGLVVTDFGTIESFIKKVLIQPDGKIIAAGSAVHSTQMVDGAVDIDFAVARYNSNGTLDPSFNGNGIRVTNIAATNLCNSAGLGVNGTIVLCGSTYQGSDTHLTLVRYLSTGQLDNTFSNNGIKVYNPGTVGYAVAVQPGGDIIVGGNEVLYPNTDAMIVHFKADGTPDNQFAPNGKIVTDLGGTEYINDVNIFKNRIYALGQSSYDGSTGLVLAYSPKCNLNVNIPDATVLQNGVDPNTVYIGYLPASFLILQAKASGGTPPYYYRWDNGLTFSYTIVTPTTAGKHSVKVTDVRGCTSTAEKFVNVVDVRCGDKDAHCGIQMDKVLICQAPSGNPSNAKALCVSPVAVRAFLNNGSYLGNCKQELLTTTNGARIEQLQQQEQNGGNLYAYPNPSSSQFSLVTSFTGPQPVEVVVYDEFGRIIEKRTTGADQRFQIGRNYRPGVYIVECTQGNLHTRTKLVKQQ